MSTSADETERKLPEVITIPDIKGEMCRLRPATWADCELMEEVRAFDDAEAITGKSKMAERAAVRAWVARSVAWTGGSTSSVPDFSDPESRGVMAWSMLSDSEKDENGEPKLIGMVFLVDIDGWSRSARLQVVLGIHYRGRGYSRDVMPRVMTYGFARTPVGLGLERIWLSLPDENTRNSGVYESLGFDLVGHSRNALWNSRDGKYHDMLIYDEIAEEYDPIRSLAAFGLHYIIDNPGVKEALAARDAASGDGDEHDSAESGAQDGADGSAGKAQDAAPAQYETLEEARKRMNARAQDPASASDSDVTLDSALSELSSENARADSDMHDMHQGGHTEWAYSDDATNSSSTKRAWWRNLGRNRNRER